MFNVTTSVSSLFPDIYKRISRHSFQFAFSNLLLPRLHHSLSTIDSSRLSIMTPKSIDLGAQATSGITKVFIRSQLLTKPQRAPANTDLSGQVAIVTGASTGLGFKCVEHLLSLKLSHVILAVRSLEKGKAAAKHFLGRYPSAKVEVWELEMTSYPSIQAFSQRVSSELPRLDIAILNAAVIEATYQANKSTGHDRVIQVNYLSTFLLAILLLPSLKTKSPGKAGRLTIVNSSVALGAKFATRSQRPLLSSFDTPTAYDATNRYNDSKLLGQLFLVKLLPYLRPEDVIVNIVDPGFCKGSELHRTTDGLVAAAVSMTKALTGRTPEAGAWTYIDAAVVKGAESHGCFCMDWKIAP